MALPSGFWVDESVTAFVVTHPRDPSFAVAPQVPQSIYYWLPRAAVRLIGDSEMAYRMPSLLLSLLSLWVIGRLAARLIHPEAAWLAVFVCLSLRAFNFEAIDARPYALGILIASASLWFVVRWFDDARWVDAFLFLLSAALLWRAQLVFWPFYFVYAGYSTVRLWRRDTRVGFLRVAFVFALLALLLAPAALDAYSLFREAKAHAIADLPAWRDLAQALKLPFAGCCLAAMAILGGAVRKSPRTPRPDAGSLLLCLTWWLAAPLILFCFSWVTGASVFVPRYFSEAIPGIAMAVLALGAAWMPLAAWRPAAALFGVGVLMVLGDWTHPWPAHAHSGWREAAQSVRASGGTPAIPVLCPSPFIEAQSPAWTPNRQTLDFLSCHLLRYRPPGRLILLPFKSSPEAEAFARRLLYSSIRPAGRVFLYGADMNVPFWRDWLLKQPELAGWRGRSLGEFGDVDAVLVEAP